MTTLARVDAAVAARRPLIDAEHVRALRLFDGHLEGDPRYVVDAYGTTLLIHHHAPPTDHGRLVDHLLERLPWVRTVVVKERLGATVAARRGSVVRLAPGSTGPDTSVLEHGVRYAVDLLLNRDAGFYLDTRHLRSWLLERSAGKEVLNTFAHTGSLGVAARAGGASRVLQTDASRRFLEVAKASYALNGFTVDPKDFQVRDVWSLLRGLRLRDERFDCVVVDPPFFSATSGGTVDLNRGVTPLVNKVRPVVRSGGSLVVVNNALFVSGAAFMRELEALCVGGWMEIERIVPTPDDVSGFPSTRVAAPVVDPAPFGHSTKIAILTVRHRA